MGGVGREVKVCTPEVPQRTLSDRRDLEVPHPSRSDVTVHATPPPQETTSSSTSSVTTWRRWRSRGARPNAAKPSLPGGT